MTRKDAMRILNRKTSDIMTAAERVKLSIVLGDGQLVDATVTALEREIGALKMLIHGARLAKEGELN